MRSRSRRLPTGCGAYPPSAPAGRRTISSHRARQRIALQRRLAALGYKIADFDGHFDFDLRDAVRDLQRRYGMIPDGYPGRAFLERVGVRAP